MTSRRASASPHARGPMGPLGGAIGTAAGWSAGHFVLYCSFPLPAVASGCRRREGGQEPHRAKSVQHYETYDRTRRASEGAEPCPERRRAADDDPDPVQRAAAGATAEAGHERDRHGRRDRRAGGRRLEGDGQTTGRPTRSTISCANCATARRLMLETDGTATPCRSSRAARALRCMPAASRFPGSCRPGTAAPFPADRLR